MDYANFCEKISRSVYIFYIHYWEIVCLMIDETGGIKNDLAYP